jgi:hypothetical protein
MQYRPIIREGDIAVLDEPDYLDVKDLFALGWTRHLVEQHLGPPDELFPVNHWANWSGKKAWRRQTVELVEMTQGFEVDFLRSARRRTLAREVVDAVVARIYSYREGRGLAPDVIESEAERRRKAILKQAADIFSEARRRGYRTPHKC